jgi:perosamine synthetase
VVGTWFTSVLEEAEPPEAVGYEPSSCPHAEHAARHLINLPTHPRVTESDVRTLTTALVQSVSTSRSFSRLW